MALCKTDLYITPAALVFAEFCSSCFISKIFYSNRFTNRLSLKYIYIM